MKKMKYIKMDIIVIGICDDQKEAVHKLEKEVEQCCRQMKRKVKILSFLDGENAIHQIHRLDILFLDIEMPHMDGIEVGKYFFENNKDCKIIMATGREDRIKEAFKINAFRFISKPYQTEEIEEALESCFRTFTGMSTIRLYENRVMHEIQQKDIICIEAYDGYIEAQIGSKTMRKDCSLLQMEDILDSDIFFRISKSCIVNLMKIDSYKKGKINIKGKDTMVARRRRKDFEIAFQRYDLEFRGE